MTLINTLKKQVDLPVWEWCRFAPVVSATGTSMCSSDSSLSGRYIYYNLAAGSNFWRYDTWSDSWNQLASPINLPTSPSSMIYKSHHGFTGRIISATSTSATIPGLFDSFNGNTIIITSGTGAGQERVISNSFDPVIADNGTPTAVTTSEITDTTKSWTINQFAGHQVRIVTGAGVQQIRKILYNSATVLTTADAAHAGQDFTANNIWSTALSVVAGLQSQYIIESSVVTVPSWTIIPDNTSRFTILSGTIFMSYVTGTTYGLQLYDVASDMWYVKTNNSGIISANIALVTDVSLEHIQESIGSFITSTATSGGASTLTDSNQSMSTNRYANFLIKITSGTGIGQQRTILANTTTTLTVIRPWEVNPNSTSGYRIFADYDKIFMAGNAHSTIYQYSLESDQMVTGKQFDFGSARIGAATLAGVNQQGIPLASITSATTTATATTAINHSFQTGQSVTITGDTSINAVRFNITATITVTGLTTFTYTIVSVSNASATFTALATTLLVDSTKNWAVNQFAGMILTYTTGAAALQTGTATNVQIQITSNTATTITFSANTIPVNGTSRYSIVDVKSFGADVTINAQTDATNNYGTASSGSTTTLVDSSKSWITNQWSTTTSRRLQIIAGTGAGALLAITSNTATTLTFSTQSFTPDATTQYRILDSFGYCTATGSTTTLTDANQVWVVNAWAGQAVKFTSGSGSGQQAIITSNTATVLTFGAVVTAPTATTTYSILYNPITGLGCGLSWCGGSSEAATKGNYMILARGGASSQFSRYDITTERWKNISTSPFFETLSTGTYYAYDGVNRIYFQKDATNRIYYYDVLMNVVVPSSTAPYATGVAVIGNRMTIIQTADGLKYLYFQRHSNLEFYRVLLFW